MPNPAPEPGGNKAPAKRRGKRLLKRAMIYLLVIYLSWLLIGFFIQRSILFPRSLAGGGAVGTLNGIEVLNIETPDGPVEAWFIPGDGVSAEHPGPLVIFAHGNAELIDHWPDELRGYKRLGISVLLPEFRGYGRSAGEPGQRAITGDYVKFYDIVTKRPEVDTSRIILHGRSIGGAVAAQLAAARPSAVLILQSSPASIRRMAARFLFPFFLVRDPFDSVRVVKNYENPVLVMHGKVDNIVPPAHADRLKNASTNPQSELIWYDVDHNTLPPTRAYWDDVERFLKDTGVLE
ncbi:MAG: alpha/beta hydrolase [Phycisphaerales bacterium]